MAKYIIKKIKPNHFGFSLVELMISVGLLSAVVLAISWTFVSTSERQKSENFLISLDQNRLGFQSLITSDRAWNATLANNVTMACLISQTSCTLASSSQPQNFKLYDQNAGLNYDGTSSTSGFTTNGVLCNNYPTAPCVLHLNLTWHPICETSTNIDPTCLAPYIQIKGDYVYHGSLPTPVNWDAYSFLYVKAVPRPASLNAPCPNPPVGPPCTAPNVWVCVAPSTWKCLNIASPTPTPTPGPSVWTLTGATDGGPHCFPPNPPIGNDTCPLTRGGACVSGATAMWLIGGCSSVNLKWQCNYTCLP